MTEERTGARELFVTITDGASTTEPVATRMVPTDQELSTTLAMMVADALDENPLELSPPLFELVDAEAIGELFTPTSSGEPGDPDEIDDGNVRVEVELYGCTVRVESVERPGYAESGRGSAVEHPPTTADSAEASTK